MSLISESHVSGAFHNVTFPITGYDQKFKMFCATYTAYLYRIPK